MKYSRQKYLPLTNISCMPKCVKTGVTFPCMSLMRKNSIEETKHAEKLLERMLYLEGIPKMEKDKLNIGKTVKEQLENDYALEKAAIQRLQKLIILCDSLGDAGSSDLLEHILLDEERHANDEESFLQQIKDMGIENFLTTQVHNKEKS